MTKKGKIIQKSQKNNLIQGSLFDTATINYFQTYVVDFLEKGILFIYFETWDRFDTFILEWKNIRDTFYKKNKFGCSYYFVFFHENAIKDVYIRFAWLSKKKTKLHSDIFSLLKNNINIKALSSNEKIKKFMLDSLDNQDDT